MIYKTFTGELVDTGTATMSWEDALVGDADVPVSAATGRADAREVLYKNNDSYWRFRLFPPGLRRAPQVHSITQQQAARWLVLSGHDLPEDLKIFTDLFA